MPRRTRKPGSKQQRKRKIPKLELAKMRNKLPAQKFGTSKHVKI